MAEQARGKGLYEEETNADAQWPLHILLRECITDTRQHDDEEARHYATWQEPREFKGQNDRQEIHAERQNPKQWNGCDVRRQIAGYSTQLHRCAHREQNP